MPKTSGPLVKVARLTVAASSSASAGQSLAVSSTVVASASAPRVITTPTTSALLVVEGSKVVAETHGGSAPEAPLEPGMTSTAQAIPRSVRLIGCASGGPLAAGSYSVVAVLGYRVDSFNNAPNDGTVAPQASGSGFVLVSAPRQITVH